METESLKVTEGTEAGLCGRFSDSQSALLQHLPPPPTQNTAAGSPCLRPQSREVAQTAWRRLGRKGLTLGQCHCWGQVLCGQDPHCLSDISNLHIQIISSGVQGGTT